MSKTRKHFSLDNEIIEQICRVSASKGIPDSEVVEKYLEYGLGREVEHTSAERYHFQRNFINKALNSVLRLFGITEMEGSLTDKFRYSLYIIHGNSRAKLNRTRYGILQTSLFEILNNIKDMDEGLFKELLSEMSYFGKIRDRYLALYPKTPKSTVHSTKRGDTLRTNNNITNNITNPVTDILTTNPVTEMSDADIAQRGTDEDEEYLKEKQFLIRHKSPRDSHHNID